MPKFKSIPVLAVVFSLILFTIQLITTAPPSVKPASAPTNEFSAERAYQFLQTLLAENKPHPVGSPQNKIVKQRLIVELEKLGIEYQEQSTWACSDRACAYVENVIGVIPGSTDAQAIALMAHYDSVPMSPGAGDNGAGVVAILEGARALVQEAPFRHPVYLVFTDSEEMGLIGATAFFHHHPLAGQIAVVLDFEGSGTAGNSMVLRTSGANEFLINTFADGTSSPYGFSFTNEIFKRMPNDTDFSVPMGLGIPGIDFVFAGERNHYHTPNDNLENIDLRTIQHHGENLLPFVRTLADANLTELGNQVVYNTFYNFWVQWLTSSSVFILLFCVALLGFSIFQFRPSARSFLFSFFSAIGVFISTSLIAFGAFQLIGMLEGPAVPFPANEFPLRMTLLFSTLTGALAVAGFVNRYFRQADLMLGVWLFWLVLCLALVVYLPDAANLLLVPTFFGCLILAVASRVPPEWRPGLYLLTLIAVIPPTLGNILPLEESQGYRLIAATFPFIALYFVTLTPLLKGQSLYTSIVVGILGLAVSILFVLNTSPYSALRPQMVNINYYDNADNGESYYTLAANKPVEGDLRTVMDFSEKERRLLSFSEAATSDLWVSAPGSGWPLPQLVSQTEEKVSSGRQTSFQIESQRGADSVRLLIPASAGLHSFEIDGMKYPAGPPAERGAFAGYSVIAVFGVYQRSVPLRLSLETRESVEAILIDISTQLPAGGDVLTNLRSPEGAHTSPVGRGDQAYLITSVSI